MDNKTYDILKAVALFIAPTLTFIAAVLPIWHVPFTQEITATLAAVDILIGSIVVAAKKVHDKNLEDAE